MFENNQYVGLVHYRRYFAGKALYLKKKQIASESELLTILEKYDVILPRNGIILLSQFTLITNMHIISRS